MMSVNWSWMNRIPLAFAASIWSVPADMVATTDRASFDVSRGHHGRERSSGPGLLNPCAQSTELAGWTVRLKG